MPKFSRLLQVLNLLRSRPGISATDLAFNCGVSRRTIFRDILYLSSAEIPVYYDKGYRLLPGTFLPALNFNSDEYLTLKGILSADLFNGGDIFRGIAKNILSKVEVNLSTALKDKLKESCSNLYPTLSLSTHTIDVDKNQALIFKILKQALFEKKSVFLNYGIERLFKSYLRVDPLSLILRRGVWYLIGHCRDLKEYFPFSLNCIKKVTLTNSSFIRPKDFSLESFLQYSWGVCQAEIVTVELSLFRVNRLLLKHISVFLENISKHKNGSSLYRLKVRGINEIAIWLLTFQGEVEVKGPPELKARLSKLLDDRRRICLTGKSVKRRVPTCPVYRRFKALCNDFCLDLVF